MAKGIAAFIVVLAPILVISMLSGIGYFAEWNVDYNVENADADVQSAHDALMNQTATDTGGSTLLEFTTGASNTLNTLTQILGNTSGVVKLLFGFPDVIADTAQLVVQFIFGITFLGFIRGVVM